VVEASTSDAQEFGVNNRRNASYIRDSKLLRKATKMASDEIRIMNLTRDGWEQIDSADNIEEATNLVYKHRKELKSNFVCWDTDAVADPNTLFQGDDEDIDAPSDDDLMTALVNLLDNSYYSPESAMAETE